MMYFDFIINLFNFKNKGGKNQILVDQIVEYFKKSLKDESVNRQLLYHTYFEITMRKEDYDDRYQSFGFIIKNAVEDFRKIIVRYKRKYDNYNCSHSPFWHFCFYSEVDSNIQESTLKPFEIRVKGEIFPVDYTKDTQVDVNSLTVSVRSTLANGTQTKRNFIVNRAAFVGLQQLPDGSYIFPIGSFDNENGDSVSQKIAYAKLENESEKYPFVVLNSLFDSRVRTFEMTTLKLYIAGKNAQNKINGIPTLRIDNKNILNPHALLEYRDGKLYLSSDQQVTVAGSPVGNSPVRIKENQSIFLNDMIQIVVKQIR